MSTHCQIQHCFFGYHNVEDNSEDRKNAKVYKGDASKTQHKDNNVNVWYNEHHTHTHFIVIPSTQHILVQNLDKEEVKQK